MTTTNKCLVFVHVPKGGGEWRSEGHGFARVPQVGEYVCLGENARWYEVSIVVHLGFESQYDAEIYTVSKSVAAHELEPRPSER